ncbi:hypothetical protein QOT17_25615 [Balamuthia mandrillaris]
MDIFSRDPLVIRMWVAFPVNKVFTLIGWAFVIKDFVYFILIGWEVIGSRVLWGGNELQLVGAELVREGNASAILEEVCTTTIAADDCIRARVFRKRLGRPGRLA